MSKAERGEGERRRERGGADLEGGAGDVAEAQCLAVEEVGGARRAAHVPVAARRPGERRTGGGEGPGVR